jgi:hypothetical protein
MFEKARSGRDAFTFSLHGMTAIASFTIAPAIADDQVNQAWSRRLEGAATRQRSTVRRIEDFLARYFAPGCCQAT